MYVPLLPGLIYVGFQVNLRRKKMSKIQTKFCIVILVFLRDLERNIFNLTKFKTQKIDFLTKRPQKNIKTVWKCFPAPFLPLLTSIRDRKPPNSSAKRYFLRPLLSYFAEFSATWHQCGK